VKAIESMRNLDNVAEVIRAFVRGECGRSALASIGIRVSRYDNICEVDNPGKIMVQVPISDIASGLVRFRNLPKELQEWATLILTSSSFVGLDLLNQHSQGDVLLNALWDASFEGHYPESAFHIAEGIIHAAE
jgi:hypothetical protein